MNIRSQVAKLRQQTGTTQFNKDVRAISDLMDELAAEAAGGGESRKEDTLSAVFDGATAQTTRSTSN
ncbi:hypothetical protein YA0729_02470 [Pseudomonas simiae]|uniref:hypothetical protein n=1 Tax=Pseudomonas simiae TaxID=321846 RepID=UPI0018E60611|nr:hypothetical protein [Pseudomonas simiae]MBI6611601.1 hypothetical protein [Pseudomonas simiae]